MKLLDVCEYIGRSPNIAKDYKYVIVAMNKRDPEGFRFHVWMPYYPNRITIRRLLDGFDTEEAREKLTYAQRTAMYNPRELQEYLGTGLYNIVYRPYTGYLHKVTERNIRLVNQTIEEKLFYRLKDKEYKAA